MALPYNSNKYTNVEQNKDHIDSFGSCQSIYQTIFHNTPIPYIVFSADNLIKDSNEATHGFLGYHKSDLKGKNVNCIFPDDLRLEAESVINQLKQEGSVSNRFLVFQKKDARALVEHFQAENTKYKDLVKFLEDAPDELVKYLQLMVNRKTFKGKCEICEDW